MCSVHAIGSIQGQRRVDGVHSARRRAGVVGRHHGVAQRDVHGRGPPGERGLDLRDLGRGARRPRELEAPQRQPAVLGELVEVLEQRVADVRASH